MPTHTPQNGENTAVASDMLSTQEAAQYLGLAPATLSKWRVYRTGPRFLKLGRSVRYRRADLDAYLASNTQLPTS